MTTALIVYQMGFAKSNVVVTVYHKRSCLSGLVPPVQTLPSKSGPEFSYLAMQQVPHVHTENRMSLSSGHLA